MYENNEICFKYFGDAVSVTSCVSNYAFGENIRQGKRLVVKSEVVNIVTMAAYQTCL